MGGGGKISVLDFHGNTSGQLLSGAKPFCHTLRKTAEHRGGIPFRQDILGESSGISHTLGPGRKRLHRPVVDTVGVLPEKPSVALEMGDEKVHVRVCQFSYGCPAYLRPGRRNARPCVTPAPEEATFSSGSPREKVCEPGSASQNLRPSSPEACCRRSPH